MDPREILKQIPERRFVGQKKKFRRAVLSYVRSLDCSAHIESGLWGSQNIIIGNPDTADFVVYTNYDTCKSLPSLLGLQPCSIAGYLLFFLFRLMMILVIPLVLSAALLYFHMIWLEISLFSLTFLTEIGLMVLFRMNPFSVYEGSADIITLLYMAEGLQQLHRKKVCFVLLDRCALSFSGAGSYRKAHQKALKSQICLNLHGTGWGNQIFLFPGKRLAAAPVKLAPFQKLSRYYGQKMLFTTRKGLCLSGLTLSTCSCSICAAKRKLPYLFLKREKSGKDSLVDMSNVNILRAAILSLICCSAAK